MHSRPIPCNYNGKITQGFFQIVHSKQIVSHPLLIRIENSQEYQIVPHKAVGQPMQRPPCVKHNTICRMWSKSDVCIRIFDTKGQEVQVTSCKLVALWFEHAVILGKQYINFVSLTWWSTIERKWKKELEANQNNWEAKVKMMVVLKKGCIKDAAKCKLQRAYMPYAGRGGRIAQMPVWPRGEMLYKGDQLAAHI